MASMEYSEATTKRDLLQTELNEISRLLASRMALYISPMLVHKEILRLSDDMHNALMSMAPPMGPDDIRIPVEGESMLSNLPDEFGLSSSEATEKFKQKLKSELKELTESTAPIHFTSEFIQKVINHTEAYLKKQRLHECAVFGCKDNQKVEMEYYVAIQKRDRLQAELKIIRSRAMAVDPRNLLKLMDAEIHRLDDDISNAILSTKHHSDEIKIPVEGESMLSRVPAESELSSAAEIETFIQRLRSELGWVMSLDEQFPLTFQFIQRVIGHAERYMMEKCPFEVAVFGRITDNRTA